METAKAKELLRLERNRTEELLSEMNAAGRADRTAANQDGDMFDSAQPLTDEGTYESVRTQLEQRLAAIGRAEKRVAGGTYGHSLKSGKPISDERLEADPTAELTVEEELQGPSLKG
jgi:DnaK suppressor protein